MPKDSARFVSSSMAARKSRVQPVPDFRKLHRQWENKLERRKQTNAKITVMEEFELSKSNKKLPKPENRNSTKQDQHGAVVESGLEIPSVASYNATHEYGDPMASDDDFRCDTNALESILSNVGITMPPPTSLAMDPSTKMKTVSFAASAAALSSCRLTSNFEAPSPSVRGHWVKDRNSIYDKWIPAATNSAVKLHSAVKLGPAGRVPMQSGMSGQVKPQMPAANSEFIAGRTRSRFDIHFGTPTVEPPNGTTASTVSKSVARQLTISSKETVSKIPRSRSASKPRAARQLLTENASGKTSTPRTETRSESRKKAEVPVSVARVIKFDDSDGTSRGLSQLKVGEKKDEKPKTPSSAVRRARRSATAEGYRRSPMNAVYQDINSQAYSSPSSPWRDNILSGGLGSQVRSPLSVLGRNQINRAGLPHHGDIAKKTYAGGSLTSTKEAVAELMAMERWLNKENVVAHVGQTLPTVDTRATVMLKSIHVDASVENSDVDSQAETKVPKYSARVAVERDVAELFDRSVDSGNKENVRIGLDVARRTEKEAGDMIIESLSQLDKRARTLRRRSQLTNDVDERARLMRQLEIIQQRRRELDSLQQEIGAKLGMYVSEDDPSAGKENVAEVAGKCDEPLNLKVVSSTATSENATDADEPLNLKVCGSRGTTDDVACCGSGRVILGDITARIVGEITDDDYIEVPDSPVPADGISEENVKDAEQMLLDDGLHQNDSKPAADDDVPLDLCVVKRSDAASSSESAAAATATPVKGLQHYLASLNLSVISDAAGSPPRSDACGNTSVTSSSGSPAVTRSPDMSSEFVGYQTYCPLLTDEDSDVRCGDPVAMMLLDGDEQHFRPIIIGSPKLLQPGHDQLDWNGVD